MAESLEKFKSYIGKSETAFDVVTGATMLKFAATLGLEKAPVDKGEIVPPGWHGGFFPPSHRPSQMREDAEGEERLGGQHERGGERGREVHAVHDGADVHDVADQRAQDESRQVGALRPGAPEAAAGHDGEKREAEHGQ